MDGAIFPDPLIGSAFLGGVLGASGARSDVLDSGTRCGGTLFSGSLSGFFENILLPSSRAARMRKKTGLDSLPRLRTIPTLQESRKLACIQRSPGAPVYPACHEPTDTGRIQPRNHPTIQIMWKFVIGIFADPGRRTVQAS
ncbi:MAG: hypothetical protein OEM91_10010, partial [Hyphomicrobiales bacterium]|nr:hypothetical protein [Hyphomicrobiales bacterium]